MSRASVADNTDILYYKPYANELQNIGKIIEFVYDRVLSKVT